MNREVNVKKKNKIVVLIDIIYKWEESNVMAEIKISTREKKMFGLFYIDKIVLNTIIPEDVIGDDLSYISYLLNTEASLFGDYDKLIITREFKTYLEKIKDVE